MLLDRGEKCKSISLKKTVLAWALLTCFSVFPALAQFDLTVNMTEFSPHLDQLFKLRVVDTETNQELTEFELERITDADFTASFSNILQAGKTYNIDAFADFNMNQLYDPPPADHAWRIVLTGVTNDTTITLEHTPVWVDIAYPNPGQPEPEPIDSCDCDLNGDGVSDTGDVFEWVLLLRNGTDNLCLDYNRDNELDITDLVSLLIDIRAGGCIKE